MTVLDVKGIVAGYSRGDQILKGVDLCVNAGEIVCIVGPNGAGKSTMLKTIAGLLNPSAGEIRLGATSIFGLTPREISQAGVAFVPQEHNVFPNMTVFENLEIGAFVQPKGLARRADEVMKHFPILATKRRQLAKTLSGGQRQLLAMGMALMVEPKLLLLDEPTAGLSPKAAGELFTEITMIAKSGIAIALVEQNARDAMKVSDRTYILVDGKNSVTGQSKVLLEDKGISRTFLGG